VGAEILAAVEVTRVFTPEAVLPIQVTYQPAECWLQRLCLAVFDDALRCLGVRGVHGGPRARARTKHEAWAWVLSDTDYCFSFTTVCSVLHLNAEAVRRQLRHCFEGGAPQAGVSRKLRQPLSRAPSARRRSSRQASAR
jgi:hypothetical protein